MNIVCMRKTSDVKMVLFVTLLLSLVEVSHHQYAAAQCLVSTTVGEDLTFVFRLNPDTNGAITGLQTYDATEVGNYVTPVTGPSCSTTTFDDGAYQLTIGAENGQRTCGLVKTGTDYEFAVIAEGPGIFYRVTCDSGDLQTLPVTVTEDDYGTTHPQMHLEYNHVPVDVQFDVFAGDGTNAPVNHAYLGQKLRLQLIYNQGYEEKGTSNWGYNFHTSFLMQQTGTFDFALEIVTLGLGTLVDIEVGQAAWTRTVFVKRNHRAYVSIPSELVTGTYDTTVWQAQTDGGIKITAIDDRIGVRAISTETSMTLPNTDSYVILPDELLGDSYTLSTGLQSTSNGQVVLVFTESSTLVTFDFDPTAIPTTIAGETVTGTDSYTLTTGLDDNNILRIYCDKKCGELEVNANKPFAVIAGNHPNGEVVGVGQMTPETRLGNKFVLFDLSSTPEIKNDYFTVRATEPGDAITSSVESKSIFDDSDRSYNIPGSDVAIEVESVNPVSILKRVTVQNTDGIKHRSIFQYPSISQWGIHQSFYVSEGYTYHIYVVAEKGVTEDISVTSPSPSITYSKLGDAPNFASDLIDVVPISGSATYELYNNGAFLTLATAADEGLVEFRSTSPFMLLIATLDPSNDDITVNVPFGQRYPLQCTSPTLIALNRGGYNYGNTVANTPGDTLDNDCDGKMDEEELNGLDDDGDNLIDEDVSITRNYYALGIKVTKLEIATDSSFTGTYAQTIIDNGCLTSGATGLFDDLAPFTHRTDLDSVFDDYWVLTSPVFDAFRLPGMTSLYFRVEFGFCGGDISASGSECTNSCQAGRKKRDLNDKVFGLSAQLQIKDGNISTVQMQNGSIDPHPCRLEPIFLIPVTLLLMMLLVESISVGYMLMKRAQMRP